MNNKDQKYFCNAIIIFNSSNNNLNKINYFLSENNSSECNIKYNNLENNEISTTNNNINKN